MPTLLRSTPQRDGFRMPGEFERHTGCWMAWPERPDNWRDGAEPAQRAFAAVATAIAAFEPVTLCASAAQWERARSLLPDRVRVVELTLDDAWLRDQGPTFVVNPKGVVRGIDWRFNAWGEKYVPYRNDDLAARKICELASVERYRCDMILEGGSIHVDGEGACLTTEECLLNPNRNPLLGKPQIEATLRAYLGVREIVWLGGGVYMDDDTNGHVDQLACFVRPGVVALHWTDDSSDPQYERSREALERLSAAVDARGRRLEVRKIPGPGIQAISQAEYDGLRRNGGGYGDERAPGRRMAASYINFYIANGGIIMPGFDDPMDKRAKAALESLFPGRQVVQIPSRDILLGGGNIHCITQQQPG